MYSNKLKTWNEYYDTPIYALTAQCIWCTIIILFIGSSFIITSYELLAYFSMYSYWIFYLATGIGLLIIRHRRSPDNNVRPVTYRVLLLIAKYIVYGTFIFSGIYIMVFS